jgi:hypothetical protein
MKKISLFLILMLGNSLLYAADVYTTYGNTSYGSDGTNYTTYGNTTYGSNGTIANTYGNSTYGSSGKICANYGNTTYCN